MTISTLPDIAVTPTDLLARVRAVRRAADAAELEILELAVEWADSHPALDGDEPWKVRWPDWSWLEHPGEVDAPVGDAADYESAEVARCAARAVGRVGVVRRGRRDVDHRRAEPDPRRPGDPAPTAAAVASGHRR